MILAAPLLSTPHVWGTSIVELIALVAAIPAMVAIPVATWRVWRHLECHQPGCHKPGLHPYQHLRLCGPHHPAVPEGGVTAEHIADVTRGDTP